MSEDIAHAIACTLEAPRQVVHNEVFNVGSTSENYQVREIAEIVAEHVSELQTDALDKVTETIEATVFVSTKSIPDFPASNASYDAASGARELLDLFQSIDMTLDVFNFRPYTRLKQLQYLLKTGQIDDQFYWTSRSEGRNSSTINLVGSTAA